MNTERLQLMATMLDEVAAGTWKPTKLPEDPSIREDVEANEDDGFNFHLATWVGYGPCGFSACAIGHAMLDERFPLFTRGLSPRLYDENLDSTWAGWDAVEKCFGIDEEDAQHLFSMYEYATRESTTAAHVAERIREFIGT